MSRPGRRVFAHVVAAGLDPDGVVHDAVHVCVGVNPEAEALVAIPLRVLVLSIALFDEGGVISRDDVRVWKSPTGGFRRGFHRQADGGVGEEVGFIDNDDGQAGAFVEFPSEERRGL